MSVIPVKVIVLAAQRAGILNPLAQRAGVSHKCLVPICGRTLVEHVMEVLTSLEAIEEIRLVLEPDGHAAVGAVLEPFRARGIPITLVESHPNIVESVLRAAGADEGPFVITTADNVLLTKEGFDTLRAGMRDADGVIGVSTREHVWAVHPQGQFNFYELKEAGYANCNIYGLANIHGLRAAELFREGGQFQKNKGRLLRAFGIGNVLLAALKMRTLEQFFASAGKRFGAKVTPVMFDDGALAIDVDNERTYAIAEWVLAQRLGMDVPRPGNLSDG